MAYANPIEELKSIRHELDSFTKQYQPGDTVPNEKAARIDSLLERSVELAEVIDRGQKNAKLMEQIADLGDGANTIDAGINGRLPGQVSSGSKSGYLDLTPSGIKSLSRTMAGQTESKAFVGAGTLTTNVPLNTTPVRLPGGGLSLLSAVPTIQHDTPTWKYLVQSVRTNNAAKVAPGDAKPVSPLTIVEKDGQLDVYATLSEPVGKYILRDNEALTRFISQELVYMVGTKVQAAAIAAFLGTSGIQTVSAADSPIVSVRKGIQAVEDLGYEANLIVLNSADYFEIVTTRNAGGTFDVSGGVGDTEETPRLWGRPVVSVTSGVTAGQALVLDRNAVAIDTDNVGLETEWNPYAGFHNNTVEARTEGRFGFSVFQPAALALTTLGA